MKSILITEEERRTILNQHSEVKHSTKNYNTLYEEKSNILKLMNINEGTVSIKGLTDIPGFEKLAKILDGELSEDILKNIGDYSSTLKSMGINTLDELIEASRKWQQVEQSGLKEIKEGNELLSAFLKSKGVISEISLDILKKQTQNADALARNSLDALKETIENYTQKARFDGLEDEIINVSDNISSEGLGSSKTKLESLDKKLDELTKKIDQDLSDVRERVNLLPQSQRASYSNAIKTLSDISRALKELKIKVSKQKLAVEAAEEQLNVIKTIEGDVINFNGKIWKASELGTYGKFLIKNGIDSYPFIYAVCTFFRSARMTEGLSELMFSNLAKLQQLEKRLSEAAGDAANSLKEEIKIYSRDTSSLITMLNKKKLIIKPNEGLSNTEKFAQIIGYGGTDLENTWKVIVNILDEQVKKGVITNEEMVNILNKIKNSFATDRDGVVSLVGDSPILSIFKFKEDLTTQAKILGIDLGTTVDTAITKSSDNATTNWEKIKKYFYDNVYKPAAGVTKPKFFKALGGILLREFAFGLPLNLRYYLKPMSKFGFSTKGIVLTYCKLLLAKTIGDFVIGGIAAWGSHLILMATLPATGLTQEEAEQVAWSDFEESMKKYKKLKISEILLLGGSNFNTEYDERESTGEQYKENVMREFGPFTFTFEEMTEELWSLLRTNPDSEQVKKYISDKSNELLSDEEKNISDLKDQAFYTLTPEEQNKLTNINEWDNIIGKNDEDVDFKGDLNKLKSRLFVKAEFSGLPDLDPKISDAQKVKNALSNLDSYGYKVCLCKKELKYTDKEIKVGGETKVAKIPICNNFVRIIEYKPRNFADSKILNQSPETTGKLSPLYDKIGYIDGSTALDASPASSQFHLLNEFQKYLK